MGVLNKLLFLTVVKRNPAFLNDDKSHGRGLASLGGVIISFLWTCGLFFFLWSPKLWQLGLYMLLLMSLHFIEYAIVALFQPTKLKWMLFLPNSLSGVNYQWFGYLAALLGAFVESAVLGASSLPIPFSFILVLLMAFTRFMRSFTVRCQTDGSSNLSVIWNQHVKRNPAFSNELRHHGRGLAFIGAAILTFFWTCGLFCALWSPVLWQFGLYLMGLTSFHYLEYTMTALNHPDTLNFDSYLILHSPTYMAATVISWLEYLIEYYYFPQWNFYSPCILIGLVLMVGGQAFRTFSMYWAGTAFTHLIADEKVQSHELQTEGPFRLVRHPAYFGYYWYSWGTQLVLSNPLCIVCYLIGNWWFFNGRIKYEEYTLTSEAFFGQAYVDYQKSTPTGIPFIR